MREGERERERERESESRSDSSAFIFPLLKCSLSLSLYFSHSFLPSFDTTPSLVLVLIDGNPDTPLLLVAGGLTAIKCLMDAHTGVSLAAAAREMAGKSRAVEQGYYSPILLSPQQRIRNTPGRHHRT